MGGDYFDFFTYPNGRVAMVLGDVSGKGMPASLMMMGLQARVQVLADEPQNLAAVINRLNKITCQNCPSNRFITFFFCVLDPATGELAYCNAGHNPPVIVRVNGAVEYLDGGGPVLGILSIATYAEYRAKLEPGDVLAIYSDGVTEANNAKEEEFGDENFAEVLKANRQKTASEVVAPSIRRLRTLWLDRRLRTTSHLSLARQTASAHRLFSIRSVRRETPGAASIHHLVMPKPETSLSVISLCDVSAGRAAPATR